MVCFASCVRDRQYFVNNFFILTRGYENDLTATTGSHGTGFGLWGVIGQYGVVLLVCYWFCNERKRGLVGLQECLTCCGGRYVVNPLYGLFRTVLRLLIPLIVTKVVSGNIQGNSATCV